MNNNKGLGRGLEALFGAFDDNDNYKNITTQKKENNTGVLEIDINKIKPNPNQPRKNFDQDALNELAASIKVHGIVQPIVLNQQPNGQYLIIAGERRWRAANICGLKTVPAVIKNYTDKQIKEISIIENLQREDLNPVEEAMAYKRLIDEFNLKQDEIAERISKSRTAITNSLRLLKLDSRVQQMMVDEMISAGHARAILGIEDKEKQYSVAKKVFDEKLSVRETEKMVKQIANPSTKKEKVSNPAEDAIYESLEEKMKGITGTKVFIHRKKNNKGKIEIEYYSRDDLERIIDLFESIG